MNVQRFQIIGYFLIFILLSISGLYADITFWKARSKQIENLSTVPLLQEAVITPKNKPLTRTAFILPNGYWPTSDEDNLLKTSGVEILLLDEPEYNYIQNVQLKYPTLEVLELAKLKQEPFCITQELTVSSNSANPNLFPFTHGLISLCGNYTKDKEMVTSSCDITKPACQSEYLITRSSGAYYYNTRSPFLAYYLPPIPRVSNPLGTFIIEWTSNITSSTALFGQSAYSIEVLNEQGKRIYASGKVSTSQEGDFYQLLDDIPPQQLTLVLRVWPRYANVKFESFVETHVQFRSDMPIENIISYNEVETSPEQMTWIPDWGMASALNSLRKNPKRYKTLSPVWFTPKSNGTLNTEPTLNNRELLGIVRQSRLRLIPTISLFDADILSSILNKHRDTHIREIVNIVKKYDYDGIDLDYESTYAADKEELLRFLSELADELHKIDKELVFTALPKINDRKIYSFLPQTHEAQDWKAIGAIVDEFRIMAYDFTGQGSKQPGPLSPYGWNETLIHYAISHMPAEKVVLALPLYAHGWPKPKSSNLAGVYNDQSLSSGELKNTISPQHDNIAYIKSHSTYYKESYNSTIKEVRAEFKYNGVERVMYYLDKQSIDNRLKLAQQYGIKGVCYWRIGGERL